MSIHGLASSRIPAALLLAFLGAASASAQSPVLGPQPPVQPPPVLRDGVDEHEFVDGVVEAVDPRAGLVRVDGRVHRVRFGRDGYVLDTRGERIRAQDIVGRRVSIDYLSPPTADGRRVATHFYVLVDE
jgi:hypothetical protein